MFAGGLLTATGAKAIVLFLQWVDYGGAVIHHFGVALTIRTDPFFRRFRAIQYRALENSITIFAVDMIDGHDLILPDELPLGSSFNTQFSPYDFRAFG